jgi:hypothetical protein
VVPSYPQALPCCHWSTWGSAQPRGSILTAGTRVPQRERVVSCEEFDDR